MKTLKTHCRYKAKFLKTSMYWIIDNSKPIHDSIRYINNNSKAKSIFTYDFSRLYTNIPHDILLKQMKFVIKEAFGINSDTPFIRVTDNYARWSSKCANSKKSSTLILSKDDILELLTYILDNLYIKYFDEIYKQIIGVPMGSTCGPDLANLFLFAYEYQYICELINSGDFNYSKLRFIFRYIDDLISLNDKGLFDKIFADIYPDVLKLNNTNITADNANYLDMNIKINNGKFEYNYMTNVMTMIFQLLHYRTLEVMSRCQLHTVLYTAKF